MIRNKVVGDLFCHFADFESLHVPSKSLTPPKYTAIKASRQAITDRNPLAAVNKQPIQPRALKKDRRLKRQHSMSLHSHQKNKKKTKSSRLVELSRRRKTSISSGLIPKTRTSNISRRTMA